MYGDSIFKVIINSIKNFFKILITLVASTVTSIFGERKKDSHKNNELKDILNQDKQDKKSKKKNINISDDQTGLPDEDNIKTNPHDNKIIDDEIKLQKPQRLYKVYTKDNELKYLTLEILLDLLLKEELEKMYKAEKFKLKTATTSELIRIDKIKKRIYPPIIDRAEKDILRNSDAIREALQTSLIEDQLKNPLFPNHQAHEIENYKENTPNEKKVIDDIEITVLETDATTLKEEIKNETFIKDTTSKKEIIGSPAHNGPDKPTPEENTTYTNNQVNSTTSAEENYIKDTQNEPTVQTPVVEDITLVPSFQEEIEELQEEITKDEKKTKEELIKLKEKVEEKIKEIKKCEEQKEQTEKKEEKVQKLITDKEIIDVSMATSALLDDSNKELAKEDFEERDYDKIERQIDKMLNDITNIYLKYEKTLTPKQKAKLKKEEEKLRRAKSNLYAQKEHDIGVERRHLNEDILTIEKDGLQNELRKIHEENNQEVSLELFRRIETLEGITKEQVAKMDKRILLSRFRKANLILELSSIMALPFIKNKYFFAFTTGLIVDNHFNFINAFFRRRINQYEPANLDHIKQGQDALNGALDITYKNLVELEYLEQQAISRYPELINDPGYISQVTSLRTNLTKKYNKLMKKNKTMEKYKIKTKKHNKILKKRKRKNPKEEDHK